MENLKEDHDITLAELKNAVKEKNSGFLKEKGFSEDGKAYLIIDINALFNADSKAEKALSAKSKSVTDLISKENEDDAKKKKLSSSYKEEEDGRRKKMSSSFELGDDDESSKKNKGDKGKDKSDV